ncbi:hypothetical protein EMIHUDRAFT_433179 [Emiliania huxleyi CCMP1516]|uniref:Uncharacterized protein n=2 Tax=Emiliania huxleyi TaxID=2903 RepID=A0A0D3I2A9_EMIH1|nr:hypothetical protein EMIHUDRAFT_433179 [Emiliania huxleyi CCMP1516]EOD05394.1 hypothetical protein EMIHUDRAFT_433179 [Emiliania huxleyi CCMP1516]|eukprot:XP_005757823.1 hypothetical protein EMIHUDRAFT_433179 [Emiliania huxleyi CCMP1516]
MSPRCRRDLAEISPRSRRDPAEIQSRSRRDPAHGPPQAPLRRPAASPRARAAAAGDPPQKGHSHSHCQKSNQQTPNSSDSDRAGRSIARPCCDDSKNATNARTPRRCSACSSCSTRPPRAGRRRRRRRRGGTARCSRG